MVTSLVLLSWLLMMAVHELGHCLAAWTTGGTVQRVVLHPTSFSRTDISPNPAPLLVAWAGPVLGVVLPLLLWGVASLVVKRWRWQWLFQFFAVFCLLVNGLYIGLGWTQRVGDAGDMLCLGSEPWQLSMFGIACLIAIFICGRGLEQRLRPRLAAAQTSGQLTFALALMLMITVLAMLLLAAKRV